MKEHFEASAERKAHRPPPMKTPPLATDVTGGGSVQRLVRRFADWTDAFSVCREMDKPITVAVPVNDSVEVARIFPSGRCKHMRYESPNS